MYLKVGTTHFYRLALCNLVPYEDYLIEIQADQMMNVTW